MCDQLSDDRLSQIKSKAETLAQNAIKYAASALLTISEMQLLKKNAHVVLDREPSLKRGQAILGNETSALDEIPAVFATSQGKLLRAKIQFNPDVSTYENWQASIEAVAEKLAEIVFFSPAALRQEDRSSDEKAHFIATFKELVADQEFFVKIRTKFSTAELHNIFENELYLLKLKTSFDKVKVLLADYVKPEGIPDEEAQLA